MVYRLGRFPDRDNDDWFAFTTLVSERFHNNCVSETIHAVPIIVRITQIHVHDKSLWHTVSYKDNKNKKLHTSIMVIYICNSTTKNMICGGTHTSKK